MKESDWESLDYFDASEFSVPEHMSFSFLTKLDSARRDAGVPFIISSSFRDGDDGAHGEGLAVDIKCTRSRDRFLIIKALIAHGFTRIGVYDKHIHVDSSVRLDQDVLWWGTSK